MEEKKLEPVAKGKKKKAGLRQLLFKDGGSIEDVKEYAIKDIIIPSIINGIYDIGVNGLQILLYGKATGRRTNRSNITYTNSAVNNISYKNYSQTSINNNPRPQSNVNRGLDTGNITYSTRQEAEDVLDSLYDTLENYGVVKVGDLYDLSGIDTKHTDYNYGWETLKGSQVVAVNGGFGIQLPKATPLKGV